MSDPHLTVDVRTRLMQVAGHLMGKAPGASEDFLYKQHEELDVGRGDQLAGTSLLFGSNKTVGDFQIWGHATRTCNGTVTFDVRYEWNDIIDPNYKYGIDWLFGHAFQMGGARNYTITIFWHQPQAVWEIVHAGQRPKGLDKG